ncbi:hypothetical protein BABINDRAFT_161778 [Babjeviella inositovora NRRL Y-12698]|uniref:Probable transporter MCH1 n=1 Tax=Babjeviella inositovora NRRL Y-12698 TaxID=984486 RepID=A0A1E3QQM5_9ASCO|nr:uncharacterized protein BABINDRAFT_161778 [Babjeviella inositovora NRRL Y-12698]ODQ79372.1 hypothetical protein BABINDRAFT_161778 [Babjeviella inositovora NRRL Y-12698]
MTNLSSVEAWLTHHIRQYLNTNFSQPTLKKLAFALALVSCLSAGSILLFSLFSPSLTHTLHYTLVNINTIASCSALGMYLFLPLLGHLADKHGPVILSTLSLIMFVPNYFLLAMAYKHEWSYWYMCFAFACIGCGTSSLYFSSLLTCAKIYPNLKGMAISAPVTCYGLSALMGAQFLKLAYFRNQTAVTTSDEDILDLYRVFMSLTVMYFFVGLFNWVSASIVAIERAVVFDEASPLLTNDEEPNASRKSTTRRFRDFLRDKTAWLLLVSLFLNLGPEEMYLNNMSSMLKTVYAAYPGLTHYSLLVPDQLSLHSTSSTLSRLIMGGVSDYAASRFGFCRVYLLIGCVAIAGVSQYLLMDSNHYLALLRPPAFFNLVSMLVGASYGGIFTLYPTVVASVWGIDMMGSTWGSFMVAPAIASVTFNLLYAQRYDKYCQVNATELGHCLSPFFSMTTVCFAVSAVIILAVWKLSWMKRGLVVF